MLVRTRQGAWGESPASNLAELFDVIRGARWTSYVAPLSFQTLVERTPSILSTLVNDVPLPVIVAAAAGIAALAMRERPALALVLGSTAGVMAFAVFFSGQSAGFLQPAFFMLWLPAAIGIDAAARLISPGGWRSLRRDSWPDQPQLRSLAHVYRIELPREAGTFHLSAGGIPDIVLSQWADGGDPPAFHALDLMGQLEPVDAVSDRLHVARDHHQMFLARGWSPVSVDETGSFSHDRTRSRSSAAMRSGGVLRAGSPVVDR